MKNNKKCMYLQMVRTTFRIKYGCGKMNMGTKIVVDLVSLFM